MQPLVVNNELNFSDCKGRFLNFGLIRTDL